MITWDMLITGAGVKPVIGTRVIAHADGDGHIEGAARGAKTRVDICKVLRGGEKSAREIADAIGVTVTGINWHMQELEAAGAVSHRRIRTRYGVRNIWSLAGA